MELLSHWFFWGIAWMAIRMLRRTYFEYKVGELLGKDTATTRELDQQCSKLDQLFLWIGRALTISAFAVFVLTVSERQTNLWIVVMFISIVALGIEILKAFDEHRILKKYTPLRPILWRLHTLSCLAGASFILFAFMYVTQRHFK